MAKLRVTSGRQVCSLLAEHGFSEVRRRGSHIVMQKRSAGGHSDRAGAGSRRT